MLTWIGEAGNFVSYAFAPLSLVAPLNAVSVVSEYCPPIIMNPKRVVVFYEKLNNRITEKECLHIYKHFNIYYSLIFNHTMSLLLCFSYIYC